MMDSKRKFIFPFPSFKFFFKLYSYFIVIVTVYRVSKTVMMMMKPPHSSRSTRNPKSSAKTANNNSNKRLRIRTLIHLAYKKWQLSSPIQMAMTVTSHQTRMIVIPNWIWSSQRGPVTVLLEKFDNCFVVRETRKIYFKIFVCKLFVFDHDIGPE